MLTKLLFLCSIFIIEAFSSSPWSHLNTVDPPSPAYPKNGPLFKAGPKPPVPVAKNIQLAEPVAKNIQLADLDQLIPNNVLEKISKVGNVDYFIKMKADSTIKRKPNGSVDPTSIKGINYYRDFNDAQIFYFTSIIPSAIENVGLLSSSLLFAIDTFLRVRISAGETNLPKIFSLDGITFNRLINNLHNPQTGITDLFDSIVDADKVSIGKVIMNQIAKLDLRSNTPTDIITPVLVKIKEMMGDPGITFNQKKIRCNIELPGFLNKKQSNVPAKLSGGSIPGGFLAELQKKQQQPAVASAKGGGN